MLCIWKISLATWFNTEDECVSAGETYGICHHLMRRNRALTSFFSNEGLCPHQQSCSPPHQGVTVTLVRGLGWLWWSLLALKFVKSPVFHSWSMQKTRSSGLSPMLFLTNATAFKQQQTLDLRLQGPRKEFPFGEELRAPHTQSHKHILEHKEYVPQIKKGLQMGQRSVPRWHVESSLPESWPACLVHGLRSCWFPDFGVGQIFSMRSDCKRQDPSPSIVPQKVEILQGSFGLIPINLFPAKARISGYIFCSLSVIQEVK